MNSEDRLFALVATLFAVCFLAIVLAAALTDSACAGGWTFGATGAHYGSRHWYTNDGPRHPLLKRLLTPEHHGHGHHELSHRHHDACKRYHAAYIYQHGLTTPRGLHLLHGCEKWKADYRYHHSNLPTVIGTVDDVVTSLGLPVTPRI